MVSVFPVLCAEKNIMAEYSKNPEEAKKLLFEMMDFARQIDKFVFSRY